MWPRAWKSREKNSRHRRGWNRRRPHASGKDSRRHACERTLPVIGADVVRESVARGSIMRMRSARGAEETIEFGVEIPRVVFEMPGVVGEDGADGLLTALGMEAGAIPLLRSERPEPLGVPFAKSVNGGNGAADAEAGLAGFGGDAVEIVVDEGVFVPGSENGMILGDDEAHAEDEGELGVGKVAEEDADGPAADVRVRQEGHVELVVLEPDDAAIELLDAQRVACKEVEGGHGEKVGEIGFGIGRRDGHGKT